MPRLLTLAESLEPRLMLYGGVDKLLNNNDGGSATSHFTQSNAAIVAFGNNAVVAFNDVGSYAGADKWLGIAYTSDGGNTWTDSGTLPSTHGAWPVLARDNASGRIYLAVNAFDAQTILVFRSDDNGVSWQDPVVGTPGAGNGKDTAWITVDNFSGAGQSNVYVVTRDFAFFNQGIYCHRSTDGGDTFGSGVLLWGSGHGARVVVGPDHSVYVFSLQEDNSIRMRKSTDRGVTFGPPTTIATGQGGGINGNLGLFGRRNGETTFNPFRSNGFPQAVVNPVSGHIYLVYAGRGAAGDRGEIRLTMSSDGGSTWTTPARVNDDVGFNDQWQPTLAVSPDGTKLGVFYYSRHEDGANNEYRYYGRVASISGATLNWTPSEPISDVLSLPEFGRDSIIIQTYMGDYDVAYATNDAFHVVWADNRSDLPGGAPRKDPNVYYDKIPIVAAPAVGNSNFLFATLPQRLTFTFNQNVGASLGLDDIEVTQLPGGPTVTPSGLSYDVTTNTATFSFNTPLPDGRFRARLIASGISGPGGAMPADHTFEFTFLRGDANGDGRANLNDFNILAANFGQSPRDFMQGDFNYDTLVNLADFNILAGRFGQVLAGEPFASTPLRRASGEEELRKMLEELT